MKNQNLLLMMENRVNWVIVDLSVDSAGQSIEMEKRMPRHLKKCVGILSSVLGFADTNLNFVQAGNVDMVALNNQNETPYAFPVIYNKSNPRPSGGMDIFPVDIEITDNSRVKILYRDNNSMKNIMPPNDFQPYKVQICLKCLK